MTEESLNEQRERLLNDERVQEMIRARAYEIYCFRGEEAGREAEDWFRAESEILALLIEEESRAAAELHRQRASAASASASPKRDQSSETGSSEKPSGSPARAEHSQAQSPHNAWSPAGPAGTERAPEIGKAKGLQVDPVDRKPRAATEADATAKKRSTKRVKSEKPDDAASEKRRKGGKSRKKS